MFKRQQDTETMDAAILEVIAMLPQNHERTPRTTLFVEIAAALLIEMRKCGAIGWPTDRFEYLMAVLQQLEITR